MLSERSARERALPALVRGGRKERLEHRLTLLLTPPPPPCEVAEGFPQAPYLSLTFF